MFRTSDQTFYFHFKINLKRYNMEVSLLSLIFSVGFFNFSHIYPFIHHYNF